MKIFSTKGATHPFPSKGKGKGGGDVISINASALVQKQEEKSEDYLGEKGILVTIKGSGISSTLVAKNKKELDDIINNKIKKIAEAAKIFLPDKEDTKESKQ